MITPLPAAEATSPRRMRERRAWPRTAKSIRVLVLPEDCALDEPYGGWIIDASRGGVRLRIPNQLVPVGTLLNIRSPSASSRAPWTAVRVKHLRRAGDNWELGCEFLEVAASDTKRIHSDRTRVA
jgi:PilZ domain